MSQPIGLVLAGGLGLRLGRTKGDLDVGGRSLALRAASALVPVCRGVLISVRRGAANPAPGFPALEDTGPAGRGPLAGIDRAFRITATADLLVLACDYPRAGTSLLLRLLAAAADEDDLVMARAADDREHPLVGLWRRRTASRIREALDRESYGVHELIAGWRVRSVASDARALLNVNTPADLASLDRGQV